MSMELSTQNFCHKAKLLISTSTETSYALSEEEKEEKRSWLLHHENAPAHNALGIQKFLAKNLLYWSNHLTLQI